MGISMSMSNREVNGSLSQMKPPKQKKHLGHVVKVEDIVDQVYIRIVESGKDLPKMKSQ